MQRTEKENKKQIQETMRGHISLAGPPSSFLSSPPSPYTYTWTLKNKIKIEHIWGENMLAMLKKYFLYKVILITKYKKKIKMWIEYGILFMM